MNISKKITRKVPSSGARFWETSRKGSLGFEYLSSWKYKNSSTYLGTIITSLLQDEQCLDEQCLSKKKRKKWWKNIYIHTHTHIYTKMAPGCILYSKCTNPVIATNYHTWTRSIATLSP
jgi:hypothetical protein